MNRFYFNHRHEPNRVCYEVYGVDRQTNIRYSAALNGTEKAAQRALERYAYRDFPKKNSSLQIVKTTIAEYERNRYIEMEQRTRLRMAFQMERMYVNEYWNSIFSSIQSCVNKEGDAEFIIGDNTEDDVLCREISHIEKFSIIHRTDSEQMTVFSLQIDFNPMKKAEGASDDAVTHAPTIIQHQSNILFRGSHAEWESFREEARFSDCCLGFFYQAIKNHYYGFEPAWVLESSPVYRDSERGDDDFRGCFKGFILEPNRFVLPPKSTLLWNY